jgi:uncharacterized protein
MTTAREILSSTRTIAVVGCSADPAKPAHWVPATLQRAGYRVIPVNPTLDEVLGEKCYPSLADVPEQIDMVNVFRRAPECPAVAEQAVAVGARSVWLQAGIRSEEARRIATEGGLDYVEDDCTGARVNQWGVRAPE